MSRILLDTHAFLWFALNDSRLSANEKNCIEDPGSDLLFSPASYWEIAIKISIGKYSLPEDFSNFMRDQIDENQLTVLPISIQHAAAISSMPFHHRDPFDRLLIAQAVVENVKLLSSDKIFDSYPVTRLW